MTKIRRLTILFTVCCFISLSVLPACKVEAADIFPANSDNLDVGLTSSSELVAVDGGYMRVFYNGEKIGIEYYDDSFNIQSQSFIDMELSTWGGFYAGSDAYYLVEGQSNEAENDAAEVIRVIQYDTNWNKKGTANITGNPKIFGGQVGYPFSHGCVEMTEYNGTLYIVTGHRGYVDAAVGQGHQGFLMIAVDELSMTGSIVASDLWHSFAQYIVCKDSDLYVLEQSEGSRYKKLSKYNTENLKKESLAVFRYGGVRTSAWSIPCYASVDGIALSSDNILCLGTSIDQSKYDSYSSDMAYNVYLTVTPTSDFSENATTVKWITAYSGDGKTFEGAKITKINDNRFMISWEENRVDSTEDWTEDWTDGWMEDGMEDEVENEEQVGDLHYIFVDGNGNKVSKEFTEAALISDCQPIVKGSQIVYYVSNEMMVSFYVINTETGEFGKRTYFNVGVSFKEDDAYYKVTGNEASNPTVTYTSLVNESAKTITVPATVQKDGVAYKVTGIGKRAFAGCKKIKSIKIPDGVTSIGEWAFSGCKKLKSIKLSKKLTSIGEGAFFDCKSLTSITIPKGVKKIKEFTFIGAGLKSIKLPKNLTSIGYQAFSACDRLKSITIPDKVTKIESYAFADCKNLESITIGKKVKTMGRYLFRYNRGGCKKLKKITIKSTCLKHVGAEALFGINAYATIKVPRGKLTAYKKLFNKKAGYQSTMRITK